MKRIYWMLAILAAACSDESPQIEYLPPPCPAEQRALDRADECERTPGCKVGIEHMDAIIRASKACRDAESSDPTTGDSNG